MTRCAPELASLVVARLEAAGRTLFCLPRTGSRTGIRSSWMEVVQEPDTVLVADTTRIRTPVPSSKSIDAMDEAYGWLGLIPDDKYVLRRIVGARSLINPLTDRHLFSWRRLGEMVRADHRAVPKWHAEGIGLIVASLGHKLRESRAVAD